MQSPEELARSTARQGYLHSTDPAADRGSLVFFGGNADVATAFGDLSQRSQLFLLHGNRTRWRLHNTFNRDIEAQRARRINMADAFSDAVFCYVPMGQSLGQQDRYVAAALFGCIPIMLQSIQNNALYETNMSVVLPFERHPAVRWEAFAVLVHSWELPRLHEALEALSPRELRHMRSELARVWPRLLWSRFVHPSAGGGYLGEHGDGDAFETLMSVLRYRLADLDGVPLALLEPPRRRDERDHVR